MALATDNSARVTLAFSPDDPKTVRNFKRLVNLMRKGPAPDEGGDRYLAHTPDDEDTAARIQRLPVSRYTDNNRFELERDTLFRRYPLVLCHSSEIGDGQAMAHDALGLPLIIARQKGELKVFLNQCRHRGTRLLNNPEPVKKSAIVCPYHHWVYGLDGELRSLPQPEGFPGLCKADHGLVELPSAERHGMVFAVPDPDADINIDDWLATMPDFLDELDTGKFVLFRRSSSRWQCNWKLPIDAFLEAYHLHRLHRDTLAPLFEDNIAYSTQEGVHSVAAVARKGIMEAAEQSEEHWDLRNLVTFSLYLLPNTVIIYHPDYTSIVSFYPQSATETIIEHSMLIPEPPADEKAQGHWERAFAMTDGASFGDEDFAVCEQIQKGLAAGAQQEILLGHYERGIVDFHNTIDELIARCVG